MTDEPKPQIVIAARRGLMYCATCSRRANSPRDFGDVDDLLVGRRFECPYSHLDDPHVSAVVPAGGGVRRWLRAMDFLLTYMRIRQLPAEGFLRLARRPSYWKGFGTFLLGAALLGVSAIFVIYSRNVWPIYIALVVIPVIIVDLLLVNTGVVFVSQRPRLALRTAIYAVGALGQLVCAFAVVYVAMPPSYFASDHNPLTTLEFGRALYFSLVTLVTLGYGDIVPSHSVAMSVVCLQIVLGVYFLGVILATFVSWTSGRVPIVTVKDLEEESTRLATYRTHPPSHP